MEIFPKLRTISIKKFITLSFVKNWFNVARNKVLALEIKTKFRITERVTPWSDKSNIGAINGMAYLQVRPEVSVFN